MIKIENLTKGLLNYKVFLILLEAIVFIFFASFIMLIGIGIIVTGSFRFGHMGMGSIANIEASKCSSGLIFIGIGFYMMFLSISGGIKKYKNRHNKPEKPLICPTCMNHYYENEIKTLKCPNCKELLIPLSEYVESKKYRKEDDIFK